MIFKFLFEKWTFLEKNCTSGKTDRDFLNQILLFFYIYNIYNIKE